jgi:hypothetical protein
MPILLIKYSAIDATRLDDERPCFPAMFETENPKREIDAMPYINSIRVTP